MQRYAHYLGLDDTEVERLRKEAQDIIEQAVAFAEASPEPAVDTILEGVYA